MEAPDTITGSIEVRTANNESIGIPGQRWTVEAVPVVLETLHAITGLTEATPEAQPTGRTPDAQWTGTDATGASVTVMLWPDIPYEETAVAQAIAAAIAEGGTA